MEVYILDSLLRREEIVDRFKSLVWTERWKELGDFQLVVQSTSENRRRFTAGKRLAITESVYVMTVGTVEDTTDDDGRQMLKITGRSLEEVLEDRVAMTSETEVTASGKWGLSGTPADIARLMFTLICRVGVLDPADILPYVTDGTLFPADTIPEPADSITWYQEPASLYDAIKGICDIYDLGFRLYRNGDASQLFFNIYAGNDRTTQQSVLTPVIFSPELENLLNTTEFTTVSKTKNTAYVTATKDDVQYHRTVYPPDVDPLIDGFDRRAMVVTYSPEETDVTEADLYASMDRAGLDELAKNRAFTAFDGEISQYTQYQYGKDYYLGDLVTMQNSDGLTNSMRVTEQIFASDSEGDRSYPTLAVNLTIQPGTWESWGFQAWEDIGVSEYWSNQP